MASEDRVLDLMVDKRVHCLPARLKQAIGSESARSFAERAGISEGTMRNMLSGGNPRLDSLLRVAVTAGVSLDWLTGCEQATGPDAKGCDPNRTTSSVPVIEHLPLDIYSKMAMPLIKLTRSSTEREAVLKQVLRILNTLVAGDSSKMERLDEDDIEVIVSLGLIATRLE